MRESFPDRRQKPPTNARRHLLLLASQIQSALSSMHGDPRKKMELIGSKILQPFANEKLGTLIESILADPLLLNELAQQSYRHQLGFAKLVLHDSSKLFRVRLHAYFPGSYAAEVVHNHRAWFASAIAAGSLHTRSYVEAVRHAGAIEFAEFNYAKSGHSPGASIDYVGRTLLVPQHERKLKAGEHYVSHPDVLHQVMGISGDLMTITLLCVTEPARNWNRLLLMPGDAMPDQSFKPLKVKELVEVLMACLKHLPQASLCPSA